MPRAVFSAPLVVFALGLAAAPLPYQAAAQARGALDGSSDAAPAVRSPLATAPSATSPVAPSAEAEAEAEPAPAAGELDPAPADAASVRIVWEVKNRFRLFRHESDFLRHVAVERGDGVLSAERRLAAASGGRGWARVMLASLCVDAAGRITSTCERDGEKESYLAPADHRVGVRLGDAADDATCAWNFETPDHKPQQAETACSEEVRLRVPYGRPTVATVTVTGADGTQREGRTEILVRDLLIAGIGDSIASGEGNPDRPVALDDRGFCFRRLAGTSWSEYFRPGRAGYRGRLTCEPTVPPAGFDRDWARRGAQWMSAACHASLYGYQLRAALALAVQHRHVAVTFLPLACSGSDIERGLLGSHRAREVTCGGPRRSGACPSTVPGQIGEMHKALKAAQARHRGRLFDLVLLTVGANDVGFSELVADVMLEPGAERRLVAGGGGITTLADARETLRTTLPARFARLRAALAPMVGGDLSRTVYVSYPNPALEAPGRACGGGRHGFDIHPAFRVDGDKLKQAVDFVERQFLPGIRALALCEGGVLCRGAGERMTFVDAHQPAFAERGFCVRSESDPAFDRACFSEKGESFRSNAVEAVRRPLACDRPVDEFRAYASRARWVRTANDSYFSAMTYPDGMPVVIQPADIHDAVWGVVSAVYGGAVHPTAEGHAAMADAALPAMRRVLGLDREHAAIDTAPLPPL